MSSNIQHVNSCPDYISKFIHLNMDQLLNVLLPSIAAALFSGLLIKLSLSIAKQTWSNNYQ